MDNSFYMQQGQALLNKTDAASFKKAISHFVTANKMTKDGEVGKPLALYYLALSNLMIGNTETSYLIGKKAEKAILVSKDQSIVNLVIWPGEEKINELIQLLTKKYPKLTLLSEVDFMNVNENNVVLDNLNNYYPNIESPQQNFHNGKANITEDLIHATFEGMGRSNEDLIYFDKQKFNVVSYIQGYFCSLIGDQDIEGKELTRKISSRAPIDIIDEKRFILIDRLPLIEFVSEFKKQCENNSYSSNYIDLFSKEILELHKAYDSDTTLTDLSFSYRIQDKFHALLERESKTNSQKEISECNTLFNNTGKLLTMKWINEKIFQDRK